MGLFQVFSMGFPGVPFLSLSSTSLLSLPVPHLFLTTSEFIKDAKSVCDGRSSGRLDKMATGVGWLYVTAPEEKSALKALIRH